MGNDLELQVQQMTLGDGMIDTIQSVVQSKTNAPLIAAAAALWIKPDDIVLDATYGRGRFWTEYRPRNLITHDLAQDGIDLRHLPEASGAVDVVVLDPPYIIQGTIDKSSLGEFQDRYGLVAGPRSVAELRDLYADGIKEAKRVLRPKGRVFVKCMDFVENGKYRPFQAWICRMAEDAGLRVADTFIHYSGVGATSTTQMKVQRTSRRAQSVLLVFENQAASNGE